MSNRPLDEYRPFGPFADINMRQRGPRTGEAHQTFIVSYITDDTKEVSDKEQQIEQSIVNEMTMRFKNFNMVGVISSIGVIIEDDEMFSINVNTRKRVIDNRQEDMMLEVIEEELDSILDTYHEFSEYRFLASANN